MKIYVSILLLALSFAPELCTQVPFWCTQVSVTHDMVEDSLILKGFNTETMELATDTTTFVFNFYNGLENITDTCFTYPNDSVIFILNENEIFELCNYALIYADYPAILSHMCPANCVNLVWNGFELDETNEVLGLHDVSGAGNAINHLVYDVNGRVIKDEENLSPGSIYIKNGKKHSKH